MCKATRLRPRPLLSSRRRRLGVSVSGALRIETKQEVMDLESRVYQSRRNHAAMILQILA